MVYVREGVFSTATEYKSLKNQLLSAVESKNLKKQFTSLADDFAIVKDQFFSAATEFLNAVCSNGTQTPEFSFRGESV